MVNLARIDLVQVVGELVAGTFPHIIIHNISQFNELVRAHLRAIHAELPAALAFEIGRSTALLQRHAMNSMEILLKHLFIQLVLLVLE